MKSIKTGNVNNVLNMNLTIPDYQRPYCWSKKSVRDLLNDIQNTCEKCKGNIEYKYRIGTIILYYDTNDDKKTYEIVDGQQRIVTLSLIKYIFDNDSESYLLNKLKFSDKKTMNNIRENKKVIENWYDNLENKNKIKKIFNNNLEFLIVVVKNIDEAFQLFDSQNSSGKELYPHDLLKAFHLREMEEKDEDKILDKVTKWENERSKNIANLFEFYLYPIKCWSNKENTHKFNSNDIDEYKGIKNNILSTHTNYNYYKIFKNNAYQINLPFYSGNDFFEMVNYYLDKIKRVLDEIKKINPDIYMLIKSYLYKDAPNIDNYNNSEIQELINNKSLGMKYTCQLFLSALLFYYDRFGELNKYVINKIFIWAFMLRVDLEMINMKSINIYALGYENSKTTNNIPMFNLIANFKNHYEIADITIKKNNNEENGKWLTLYKYIEKLENYEEENEYE